MNTREENRELYVYVARFGDYDSEHPAGELGFTTLTAAIGWVESAQESRIGPDADWKSTGQKSHHVEDKIGNWAEVDAVRISDPASLLSFGLETEVDQ